MYVLRKDMVRNAVILGPNSRLFSRTLTAGDLNWIAFDRLTAPLRAKARIRYRHEEQWAEIRPLEEGRMELVFDVPQRAISPGQTVVLYDGEYVLGGGTILSADVP